MEKLFEVKFLMEDNAFFFLTKFYGAYRMQTHLPINITVKIDKFNIPYIGDNTIWMNVLPHYGSLRKLKKRYTYPKKTGMLSEGYSSPKEVLNIFTHINLAFRY